MNLYQISETLETLMAEAMAQAEENDLVIPGGLSGLIDQAETVVDDVDDVVVLLENYVVVEKQNIQIKQGAF